jgi:hypothetical protein
MVMVAAAMTEVDLVLLSLEREISRVKRGEMVGVETGGRNVLVHRGFMVIKCIATKNFGTVRNGLGR